MLSFADVIVLRVCMRGRLLVLQSLFTLAIPAYSSSRKNLGFKEFCSGFCRFLKFYILLSAFGLDNVMLC